MPIGAQAIARVIIDDDEIRIIPVSLAKLWSLRRAVRIPTVRIKAVALFWDDDDELGGRVKTGRFRDGATNAFLVVGRRRPVVVIECPGAEFDRVVFSAKHPESIQHDLARTLATNLP